MQSDKNIIEHNAMRDVVVKFCDALQKDPDMFFISHNPETIIHSVALIFYDTEHKSMGFLKNLPYDSIPERHYIYIDDDEANYISEKVEVFLDEYDKIFSEVMVDRMDAEPKEDFSL